MVVRFDGGAHRLCCPNRPRGSFLESSMPVERMSSWPPTKYKTTNWAFCNEALRRRGSLTIWFDPEMIWRPPPRGKRGRQPEFSDAAIQVCLTLKVLFGMPLRQTTGFVKSLLRLADRDWKVPDFSTLCQRQKTLNVSIPYSGGTGPLNLLIDATGIKAEEKGRPASMTAPRNASGASCILGWTRKHWRSGPSRSQPATWAMLRYCLPCSTKSHQTRRSPPSPQMVPTTRENAVMLSPPGALPPSSRLVRMPGHGSPILPVQSRATKHSGQQPTSVEPCGDDGADITAEVAPRRSELREAPGPRPHGAGLRPAGR